MTDRRMTATRPQYADYVARTSGFIPLPPRRSVLPNALPLRAPETSYAAADRRETAAAPVFTLPARPGRDHGRGGTVFRSRSSAGNGARYVCSASQGSSPPLA